MDIDVCFFEETSHLNVLIKNWSIGFDQDNVLEISILAVDFEENSSARCCFRGN